MALVGRTNVGKSTLFNRLLGLRRSIVEPAPGVTRDRIEGRVSWAGKEFTLIDTGGVPSNEKTPLFNLVSKQVEKAVKQSDLILFITSVEDGHNALDEEILRNLHRQEKKKPVLLVVNKVDTLKREFLASEFFALGLGEPITLSALHGKGIGELLDSIASRLPGPGISAEEISFRLCAVGRPNVGKSSVVNALLGEPRVIVHESPGTTRDAVDTRLVFQGKNLALIDTAGLRKRSKASLPVEYFSRTRSIEAISRSEVVLLVLEAPEGVLAQDKRIAGEIQDHGKAVVIVANKWDKLDVSRKSVRQDFVRHVRKELYFVDYAIVIPASAITGYGIDWILPAACNAFEAYSKRFKAPEIKKVLDEAVFVTPPPSIHGKPVRFRSILPVQTCPPTFLLKMNVAVKLPDSYLAYLEGKFREAFGLEGTPIRFKAQGVESGKKRRAEKGRPKR